MQYYNSVTARPLSVSFLFRASRKFSQPSLLNYVDSLQKFNFCPRLYFFGRKGPFWDHIRHMLEIQRYPKLAQAVVVIYDPIKFSWVWLCPKNLVNRGGSLTWVYFNCKILQIISQIYSWQMRMEFLKISLL